MNKERLEFILKMQEKHGVEKGVSSSASIRNTDFKDYDSLLIGENVVIGTKGFGYERDENGVPQQFPHIGRVIIGDNVEIGDNTIINRGTIGDTVIGDNVKIDGQVFIAHNCKIGDNTMIAACAQLSGHVEVGKNCWIAPNVSIIQKVKIGDNCCIGIGSVVLHDVPANTVVCGNPAKFLRNN